MDKINITSLLILVSLMLGQMVHAQGPTYIIPLQMTDNPDIEDPYVPNRDQHPFYGTCTITEDGLTFSSIEESEIAFYDIYDQKGYCQGRFRDPADFLTALFSRPGTYEVRFQTEAETLYGNIIIPLAKD